jgi:Domain of unknown function (DUF5069)
MDLTVEKPRSPKDKLVGLVSLKRVIDKAKAYNEGHLGEYDYDCPHDKPLFEFLGTTGEEFAQRVKELGTDEAIADWVQTNFLSKKSPADIEAFNQTRLQWHPDPASHAEHYFQELRSKVAPGRSDVVTWFDLLDLDEGRPVPHAMSLN